MRTVETHADHRFRLPTIREDEEPLDSEPTTLDVIVRILLNETAVSALMTPGDIPNRHVSVRDIKDQLTIRA